MNKAKKKKTIRYTKAPTKLKVKKGGILLASQALIKKGKTNLRPKLHINRGDEVVVISGADKSDKLRKVLEVFRDEGKIIVEGVNIVKKHRRGQGPGREGEIIEVEAPIFASKVMIWDESKKKASRVGKKFLDNGKKVRIAKTSGEQID
jgi:large subunit ribosomal protein L24